jgi:hypothetical protein
MEQIGELVHLERLELFRPRGRLLVHLIPLLRLSKLKFFAFHKLEVGSGRRLTLDQLEVIRQLASLEALDIEHGRSEWRETNQPAEEASLDVVLADGHKLQRLKRMNLMRTVLTQEQVDRLHTLVDLEELRWHGPPT